MRSNLSPEPPTPASKSDAILEAAASLFGEHGFEGASMSTVAGRAGVSKANVFHHYGSKEELYVAVIRSAHRTFAEKLQQLSEDASKPMRERILELAKAHLDNLLEHRDLARLFMRELLGSRSDAHQEWGALLFEEHFSRFVRLLKQGQQTGELRQDFDPAAAVTMLVAGNLFYLQGGGVIRSYPDVDFADDPHRYAERLAALIWHSVACDAARCTDQPDKPES